MRQDAIRRATGAAAVPLAVMAVLVGGVQLFAMASQDPREAVMVAAGAWALDQVPGGGGHLDPHRSGAGKDGSRLERVAGALGVGLATLEDVRECVDIMDPRSCTLTVDRLLAIADPRIEGDTARVKVYAWYRADSGGQPVMQRSWELRLARSDGVWRVVSGG